MTHLASLTLRGFKTIRDLTDFRPGQITILIGPNGAGKSNLLSFFRLLSRAVMPPDGLQTYVAEQGGASALFHGGAGGTGEIISNLGFRTEDGDFSWGLRLLHAAGDTLFSPEERYGFAGGRGGTSEPSPMVLADPGSPANKVIMETLRRAIVYQVRDTGPLSRIRNKWSIDDGRWLKEDAGNLAAVLYRLHEVEPAYYRRIVETMRLLLPFFADFEFQPEYGRLLLRWRERGSDQIFGASQAADGMLRAMALVTLLQQPEADLPNVLILDEPELGLHPYAIEILAALIQSASQHCQVIVATQSVSLIDRFEPHDIVVVDRSGRESSFRRLNDSDLAAWREEYTMSELWEKNVLGGRPAR